MEMGEFPGPSRDRHRSLTSGKSENDVAKCGVVAWTRRIEVTSLSRIVGPEAIVYMTFEPTSIASGSMT
jgi:hypothetical protein